MDKTTDEVIETFLESSFTLERRFNLNVDEQGRLRLKSSVIPFSLLPYVFRKLYHSKSISSSTLSGKYEIKIDNDRFAYIENSNGSIEFRYNGKLHSKNGPARRTSSGVQYYYEDGQLHRLDGPAVMKNSGDVEYALFDSRCALIDFIEHNPTASTSEGWVGKRKFSVTKWKDYAVVKGIDGTRALMRQTDADLNIDNFLVEIVAKPMPGYEVLAYHDLSERFKEIYNIAVSAGAWNCDKIFPSTYDLIDDQDSIFIEYNRSTRHMEIMFDEGEHRIYDFSFSNEDWSQKRDSLGNLHSIDGPAVIKSDGRHQYYIHGAQVSKTRFNSKKHDPKDESYFWTNKEGALHTDVPIFPSKILKDGTQYYHDQGALHNDLFPAITTGEGNQRFFIRGLELPLEEFTNYKPEQQKVVFTNSKGDYHRDGGPAVISFDHDGFSKKFFNHGVLHNTNGPAVYSSDGSYEYRTDGKLHRASAPALVNMKDGLVEFYIEGQKSNSAGPAVIKKDGPNTHYEFWKKDQLEKIYIRQDNKLVKKFSRKEAKVIKINLNSQEGATMNTNSNNAAPDTRYGQVKTGTVTGMKKGTLKIASRSIAQRLTNSLPSTGAKSGKVIQRLVQLSLLMGVAELVERVPEGVSDKIRLSGDMKDGFGGLARNLSGEIIGRDAVDIVTEIAPQLMSSLNELTTEDIEEMASSAAELEVPALDAITKAAAESVPAEVAAQ